MTEAEKREKVMLGLECCAKGIEKCAECPYSIFTDANGNGFCSIDNMVSDALSLLKEQEAMVMTRDEIVRDIEERAYGAGAGQYMSLRCDVAREIVDLLKEQDEGIAPIKSTTEQKKFADRIGFAVSEFWCGACHFNLVGSPKFCPNCGKKVKWDE